MPDIDFGAAIEVLRQENQGVDPAFTIVNEARPDGDYLLAGLLPERLLPFYEVRAGALTVRGTMAGLVGTDSPYPPTGLVDISTFAANTAKIANTVPLSEMFIRELHAFMNAVGQGQQSDDLVVEAVLNFARKMLRQPHMDRMELLRGDLFTTGEIDWTFVGKNLAVDYGIPTANKLANRTGTNAYHSTTSKYWTDWAAGRSLLNQRVRLAFAHPDTIEGIITNAANNIILTAQDLGSGTVEFIRNVGVTATGPLIPSPDIRERTRLVGYGKEGEILDPDNPGETIQVPFVSRGKIVMVGDPEPGTGEGLGGNLEDEQTGLELGYTHIGPTTEGRGALGRWARVYKPESMPWGMKGDAVTNGLPVLRSPKKVVILSTDMP